MIRILCTLLMIAIVIAAVVKKYHPISAFFAVSLVALVIWSIVTGQSAQGAAGTGNILTDVLEYTVGIITKQVSGVMLTCGSIFGYMGFMNKIGASRAFTTVLAKPLTKVKNPYILLGLLIIIENFLKLAMSATSLVAMLFAILYPIFIALGISNISIASAFILGTIVTWGPAGMGTALCVSLSGTTLDVAEFFAQYQLVPSLVEIVVLAVVYVIYASIADKKAKAKNETVITEEQLRKQAENLETDVPTFFAILPLVPLIFIFIFNGKTTPITLSVNAVILLAILVADVIYLIYNHKNFKKALADINACLAELGNFIGRMGFLVVGGALFAGVIGKIGGMNLMVEKLNSLGGGAAFISILGIIMALFVVACTGSYTANLNIFVPFFASVATVTGTDVAALAQLANMACGLGSGLTPVSASILFITGECHVDFPSVMKRNIIPILAASAAGWLTVFVMHIW